MFKNISKWFNRNEINQDENIEKEKPKEIKNIFQAGVGDFLEFGDNDLMELKGDYFNIVEKYILKKDNNHNLSFLAASNTDCKNILIDNFSESQHIYVYHEVFYEECIEIISEHDDGFYSHLDGNCEDVGSFTFLEKEEVDMDLHWMVSNEKYYIQDSSKSCELHKTTDNNYSFNKFGERHMYYIFQTTDREYRFMIMVGEQGSTRFYSGRRIEPVDIQNIISK